jgi:signal transduction histidine kinase
LKPYSLLRRITIGLVFTMVAASLCAFGWLYLKNEWTDSGLHKQTLLDQAYVIASYLSVSGNGSVELNLPPRLAEAYLSPQSRYHYAVRDASGQFIFDSGTAVGPLPTFSNGKRELYDYDPDGSGPLQVSGAALRTVVNQQTFFIQVEQQADASNHLGLAAIDEFIADGDWLEILFLFVLLGVSIWIVKRAIAPLTRVSKLAETIGPNNANVRLPLDDVPLEILPLVRSMNSALDRLEQGLQHQREFNASAAHQLRTPLAVLLANMDAIKDSEMANRLRVDVEHMSHIVSQLLMVARLETLSLSLDEPTDLNASAAEIAASFAPLALASGKTIELLRSDVPVIIRTNAFALREALGNVIENAINHTPAGTVVRIRVTNQPAIEVMDSGPGIPEDQRALVFDRFWKGDRSKIGAGLGLAIVKRIMTGLGGAVTLTDAPGGGALFTLIFPLTPAATAERSTSLALAEG